MLKRIALASTSPRLPASEDKGFLGGIWLEGRYSSALIWTQNMGIDGV